MVDENPAPQQQPPGEGAGAPPIGLPLELPPQEAGAAFRLEMAITNFFLGYWQYLLAALAVVLLGFFAYGQYKSWYDKGQREASARISDVEAEIPQISPLGMTETDKETVRKAADELAAIGASARGTARVEAYLKAAELYRRAGAIEQQRAALEGAAADAKAALKYAAVGALANLDLEQGKGDAAVERLRALRTEMEGSLAEQATLDLALALEHLGKPQEAIQVYDEFLAAFPESDRTADAQERRARLQGAQG